MQLDTPIVTILREPSVTSQKVKIPGPDSVTTELQQALKEDWIPILLNSSKNGKKSQYFLTNLMSST